MRKYFLSNKLTPPQRVVLSFIIVILLGSMLLTLPIMHQADAPPTTFLDHLFTAVSMVCVTGLTVLTVSDVYNSWGQTVGIILMQIGGLGLITLIAFSLYVLKQKLSLKENNLLAMVLNKHSNANNMHYLLTIYKFTFLVEAIAALCLMIDFIPRYGLGQGIFNAIFIAVSAFCNAGFDNLGSTSLQQFKLNPLVNFTLMFLIFSGGIGFGVWFEIKQRIVTYFTQRPLSLRLAFKHLSPHTKLVLATSFWLLFIFTGFTWLSEANNPVTLAPYSLGQQGMITFFQSIAFRTAGFSTIDYSLTRPVTNLMYILQMIIGGAPGGTAGGIKVTSAAVIWLLFLAEFRGQNQVTFARRTIPLHVIKVTTTLVVYYFVVIFIGYGLLLATHSHLDPFALLFETISAIATVGSSMNLTGQLNEIGQVIIIILMYLGRVGPITVIVGLMAKKEKTIHYVETDILIG